MLPVDSKDVASDDNDLVDEVCLLDFSSLLSSSLDEGFRLIGNMDTSSCCCSRVLVPASASKKCSVDRSNDVSA